MELQGVTASRPLPYDLLRAVVGEMGGELRRVMVTELNQDVFYARIVIDRAGLAIEIDSRPSDAIAVAVRAKVPIFVDESVMERAGVRLEDESDEDDEHGPGGRDPEINEEKLSAFRDFIDSLDLDDFGTKREN
jgi:bifunctional DNase/RNase